MDKFDRTFKAAIFDMDGLILDSERTVLSIWEQIGTKYGFDAYSVIADTVKTILGADLLPNGKDCPF